MATESTEKHGLKTSSQLSIITTKNAKSTKEYKTRMWDVEAANNSQIEDNHFISIVKIMSSGIWIPACAGMTVEEVEMTVNLMS